MSTVHKQRQSQLRTLLSKAVAASLLSLLCLSAHARPPRYRTDERLSSRVDQKPALRPYTVADSIEMTRFVAPSDWQSDARPDFSPDDKQFLIVTERGLLESNLREYKLLIFQTDGSVPPINLATFRTSSNRPAIDQPKWIDNDRISFLAENPSEDPQVYLVSCFRCHAHKLRRLTSHARGVHGYDVSANGSTVVYSGAWNNDAEDKEREGQGFAVDEEGLSDLVSGAWKQHTGIEQLYVLNTSNGSERAVKSDLCRTGPPPLWVSPDGRYAVLLRPAHSVPSLWGSYSDEFLKVNVKQQQGHDYKIKPYGVSQAMLLDTETLTMQPLLDAPLSPFGLTALWLPTSRSVLIAGTFLPLNVNDPVELDHRKALPVLAEVNIPGGSYDRVADIPRNERWKLTKVNSSTITFDCWKATEGDIEEKVAGQLNRQNGQWTRDERLDDQQKPSSLIRITQTLNSWPRLTRTDPATHVQTVILDPNPQFMQLSFGKEEVIHWTGKRGEPLTGGLVYPTTYRTGARFPLVIQTHGFEPDVFWPDGPFTTAFAAQELANKGVAVLQLGESPLYDPAENTPDFGPVNLSQLESAIDYLDGIGLIDRERVGLVGFSITGFQVRYALVNSKYHFAAATSAEGSDYGYFTYVAFGSDPVLAAVAEATNGGMPWHAWDAWRANSLSFNYDKLRTPLRLESDRNDTDAEVINEWENFFALKRMNKPVELVYLCHGAHPVVKPWDRMTSQQGNVDWLLFWLKNEEDPDPSKREQYQRWQALRRLQNMDSQGSPIR